MILQTVEAISSFPGHLLSPKLTLVSSVRTSALFHFDVALNQSHPFPLRETVACLELKSLNGRAFSARVAFGQPPSIFRPHLSRESNRIGALKFKINRFSQPAIQAGRWFLEVSGNLLAKVEFSITFELRAVNELLQQKCFGEEVEEEIFELNPKKTGLFSDYPWNVQTVLWRDSEGDALPIKEDFPLPDFNWEWIGPWNICGQIADNQESPCEWTFASALNSDHWEAVVRSDSRFRRRRWTRIRRIKTHEKKKMEEQNAAELDSKLTLIVEGFELLSPLPVIPPPNPTSSIDSSLSSLPKDGEIVDSNHLRDGKRSSNSSRNSSSSQTPDVVELDREIASLESPDDAVCSPHHEHELAEFFPADLNDNERQLFSQHLLPISDVSADHLGSNKFKKLLSVLDGDFQDVIDSLNDL